MHDKYLESIDREGTITTSNKSRDMAKAVDDFWANGSTEISTEGAVIRNGVIEVYPKILPLMKYHSESDLDIFYGSAGSAGLDLPFADPNLDRITIMPGERVMLYTGISCEIPEGYYGKIDTRSSTSKKLLVPLCSTIDFDYRGVIHVVIANVGTEPQTICRGEYIAQMIIIPYLRVNPIKVSSQEELSKTERGNNGFGSTGNNNSTRV